MKGLTARVSTNVIVTVVLSVLLVAGAFATYASGVVFDDSYPLSVALPEAGGILPDQQVTVMGNAVGQVSDVEVTEEGVLLTLSIRGDEDVPSPARATVLRRSPIGEQAIDLAPDQEGWEPAEPGSQVETTDIVIAPEVAGLLRSTVDLFEAIGADDLSTVVSELAVALDGRGDTLRRLGRDSLDFNRTMVDGMPEFERLLDASDATLTVLREQRDTLRSVISNGAELTEIFAEQRPNVDTLLDTGTPALEQLDAFLLNTRSNFGCLMGDLTALNEMMLGPSTYRGANGQQYSSKLDELERGLTLHTYFFQQGFSLVGQPDIHTGLVWLRVLLVMDEPATAEAFDDFRPTPATTPGAACVSEEFGRGVDAVRQPGVQEAHETSPGIDYAPQVDATHDRVRPAGEGTSRRDGDQVTPVPSGSTGGGAESGSTSADGESTTQLDAQARDEDDLARTGRDLGVLIAAGVALVMLPLLVWGGWWLRRRGSGN
jgi:virulence factor Mce-like protein